MFYEIPKQLERNTKTRIIPYKIHQTFKTNMVPHDMYQAANSWVTLNPTYDYYFYDDSDIKNYITNLNCDNFDFSSEELQTAFEQMNVGAGKADIFRYLIIFNEGGCYFDIDTTCKTPLDHYIDEKDELVSGLGARGDLHQWGLIYKKNHPFIKKTIENCVFNILNKRYAPNYDSLEGLTGPPVLDISIKEVLQINKNKKFIPGKYKIKDYLFHILKGDFFDGNVDFKYKTYLDDLKKCQVKYWLDDEVNNTSINAIVILTRGYSDPQKYRDLIKRNKYISLYLQNKKTDIVIFHEGNILPNHQTFISSFTPELKMNFINVKERNQAFLRRPNRKIYKPTHKFSLGYRHMCSFWFVDFWHYVEDYKNILRIDEDCVINFNIDSMFQKLENKVAIYGKWEKDEDFVTYNLNNFTLNFLNQSNQSNQSNQINQPRSPSGPYTNVIALNLSRLRENELLKKYIQLIRQSDYIYIYRWGDLPLWGEVLHYLYQPVDYLQTYEIKYYHGSHNKMVN